VAKKILTIVILLAIVLAAGFGVSVYRAAHRTPESAVSAFIRDLAKQDTTATYDSFTRNFKKERSEQAWRQYVRSLKIDVDPIFAKKTDIVDRFNTYPAGSDPQRFVYDFKVKNRDYQLVAVILKQDGSWKIDDLQGSYK
jgi:hypothetical protein